ELELVHSLLAFGKVHRCVDVCATVLCRGIVASGVEESFRRHSLSALARKRLGVYPIDSLVGKIMRKVDPLSVGKLVCRALLSAASGENRINDERKHLLHLSPRAFNITLFRRTVASSNVCGSKATVRGILGQVF